MKFSKKKLETLCINFLRQAKVPKHTAKIVTKNLILSEMAGHPSHGIIRLIQYFEGIKKKIINPKANPKVKKNNNFTMIECNRAFGQYSMDVAINSINKKNQISVIAVNNCSHIGRLSDYLEKLCKLNYISLIFCNGGGPNSALYPSASRVCGTNPFGFGMPVDNKSNIIVDFSTSMLAEGKVRIHKIQKKFLKYFAIIDNKGKLSKNPKDFYNGGALLPFGGKKGSGLMLACEILGGLLISNNNPINKKYLDGNNCMVIVFKKNLFNYNENAFKKQYKSLVKKIKFSRKLNNVKKSNNFLPNEWENYNLKKTQNKFVEINNNVIEDIKKYAEKNNFKFLI